MKKIFHNILSLMMAFVVLISTMSFTLNMHYCGDTLVETTVFKKAIGCGMEMDTPSTKGCEISKKNCCDNKQTLIDGQDELQLTFDTFSFDSQVFLTAFTFSYINLFEGLPKQIIPFKNYTPPLLVKDIPVLNDTFLI